MKALYLNLLLVFCFAKVFSQNGIEENPHTFYSKSFSFAHNYTGTKKSKRPDKFCNWGLREVLQNGYEYNTSGAFQKAYVLYYFDVVDSISNIGVYYQSDAFYLKDLVKIIEKNNYSNPAASVEGWGIPFYCSVYYCTRNGSENFDTISLCTPQDWKTGDKIYERKIFEFRGDKATPKLQKLFEFKKDNPDPLFLLNYEISLYCEEGLRRFIEKKKDEAKTEEKSLLYTCPFYNYLDTTKFNYEKTAGWVCFGPITRDNNLEKKKIENINFYLKGSFYSALFPTKKRYTLDENLKLKYKFFHPGRWFKKHEKFIPIYDLAVYDSVDESGKKDLINCAYNQYYYKLIDQKIVKGNNGEYMWVKIDLKEAIDKMTKTAKKYNERLEKQQQKIIEYKSKQMKRKK